MSTTTTTMSVEVRDDQGTVLGNVRVGDTKLQALERLGRLGAGGLFDREGVGLLDGDTISSNDAPYVFKPTTNPQEQQQQQHRDRIQKLERDILEMKNRDSQATLRKNDDNRIQKLERDILEMKNKDSRAVSFADYYREKANDGRVINWAPQMQGTFLPDGLQSPHIGSELLVVKPFWKDVLQRRLVERFGNGYEVGYLGSKIPDITFYPSEVLRPAPHLYVSFGDCKGSTWTGTSHSELGQGMQYAHRILDAQPQRNHVYGFITNNALCVLIKGARERASPYRVYWEITATLRFEEGMKLFFHYLQNDNGFVRPPSILGSALAIERALRPGGTCKAFTATFRQQKVVAKLYETEQKAHDDAERIDQANRILLSATLPQLPLAQIPSVLANESVWLLITPVGVRFTENTLRLRHLERLLQTLRLVHGGGIVHRDVRPANFFLLDHDGVLLNDWGSAAPKGTAVLIEGCPESVCHPDLIGDRAAEVAPQAKHDLYSLVASVSDLMAPGLLRQHRRAFFQEAFDAANREDYDAVARAFKKAGVPP